MPKPTTESPELSVLREALELAAARYAKTKDPADGARLGAAVHLLERAEAAARAPATALRPRRRAAALDPKWKDTKKKCPNCGLTKLVDPEFGVATVRGVERPNSWCKKCRATTNYYSAPRKYTTANGGPGGKR